MKLILIALALSTAMTAKAQEQLPADIAAAAARVDTSVTELANLQQQERAEQFAMISRNLTSFEDRLDTLSTQLSKIQPYLQQPSKYDVAPIASAPVGVQHVLDNYGDVIEAVTPIARDEAFSPTRATAVRVLKKIEHVVSVANAMHPVSTN